MSSGPAAHLKLAVSEPGAFTGVYDAFASDMLVFFVRRTFDVEVARDLTAETFAQAFESRRKFRGTSDGEAVGWLYAIARHQLSHYARRGLVQRRSIERLGIQVPNVADDDYERVIELAGLADLRGRVAAASGVLPAPQRDVLRLRVVDEHTYPDVAAMLGVSEQTARARVSRALRRLADVLENPTPTEVAR
jgi:RNA polymerase sigma factor (sigma-70 family)